MQYPWLAHLEPLQAAGARLSRIRDSGEVGHDGTLVCRVDRVRGVASAFASKSVVPKEIRVT